MSKPKKPSDSNPPNEANKASANDGKVPPQKEGARETVESVVVAFLLAFLFRAFEAEAFVIPTGSMAPTLYGRHKEMSCEHCGHTITIGASEEVNEEGYLKGAGFRLEGCLCPNCRAPNVIKDAPAFRGDRILVNKFPYEITEPNRWEVVVFKYPEEPKTNYIKRLVGLPNETVIIRQGDLYRIGDDGETRILRKSDPFKQRDLQLLVYNNDYQEQSLTKRGWPQRWTGMEQVASESNNSTKDEEATSTDSAMVVAGWKDSATGWEPADGHRSFRLKTAVASDQLRWLRYRHFVPSPDVWRTVIGENQDDSIYGGIVPPKPAGKNDPSWPKPRPQLITDFCSYNASYPVRDPDSEPWFWVNDLTLACTAKILDVGADSELVLELNEGVHRFRARINPQTGEATISRVVWMNRSDEEEKVLAKAPTRITQPGEYRIEFANVDNRLCLWVDGSLIPFGTAAEFEIPEAEDFGPQDADLTPIGIAARGLTVEVSHLLVRRDIYYRSTHKTQHAEFSSAGSIENEWSPCTAHSHLRSLLSDPTAWYAAYKPCAREARFDLGPDEFLMLGDNSPKSSDSRLWENDRGARHRHAVPRSALVGKAFYIYWPHAQPFLNDGEGFPVLYHQNMAGEKTSYPSDRFPFYPNVGRMKRIR